MPERTSYWLLARNGQRGIEILETRLSKGQKTLPVFSFAEEAEMFLCLRNSRDGWRVEEATTEDLLSMLRTTFKDTRYVTLDPIPEDSCLNTTGILSVSLRDFVKRLKKAESRERSRDTATLHPVS